LFLRQNSSDDSDFASNIYPDLVNHKSKILLKNAVFGRNSNFDDDDLVCFSVA
jgi:hypothetical protein